MQQMHKMKNGQLIDTLYFNLIDITNRVFCQFWFYSTIFISYEFGSIWNDVSH